MKIGVYGGSFNPCHLVHKKIVLTLLKRQGFDRIILLPTGNFYKKSSNKNNKFREIKGAVKKVLSKNE